MATPPVFTTGSVLTAAQMNAVGLWLVKTQTVGTAVSSVTVTNAFSADYDNYKIIYTGGTASNLLHLGIKLGSTATGYYGALVYSSIAAGTAQVALDNNGPQFTYIGGGSTTRENMNCEISSPYKTYPTTIHAWNTSYLNFGVYNGYLENSTSYTDFTVICSGATLTGGTIRVYGYRN